MLKINGEMVDADGMTLSNYLDKENYNTKRIAVEINYEIIPKTDYDTVSFKDGDTVEIITFMGGG